MALLQPTSYTEVGRLHRGALADERGTLVVTATRFGEGTSLVAYMLALRSAQQGQKTLLVDLNLKNTWISEKLGLTRQAWQLPTRPPKDPLTDLITAASDHDNLHFLAAPADIESVNHLRDATLARLTLESLKSDYDQIVIDTTPVEAHNRQNADPILLASAADRTIMVLLAGSTPRSAAQRAVRQLQIAGANLLGVVVNDVANPNLTDELLQLIRPTRWISRGLHSWLRHRILNAGLST